MRLYTTLYFLVIYSISIFAQQPPDVSFSNIEINWSYIVKDSTFVQSVSDDFSSPYWGFNFLDYKINEDDIYVLEMIWSQSPNGGVEGSLLHKIDLDSGNIKWINHNSSYTGNIFREGFGKGSLILSNDNDIVLIGDRSMDTIFTNLALFGFYSNPVIKSIDGETGELIENYLGTNINREYYNFFDLSNRTISRNENQYVSLSSRIIDENGLLQNTLEFRNIDDSSNVIEEPFFVLNTPYPLETTQSSRLSLYNLLNDNEMIVLFSNTDPITNAYGNNTLSWLDFSQDSNNIETLRLDVTDQLAIPQNPQNEAVLVFGEEKDVFLEQEFFDENEVKYNWISWYHDKEWFGRISYGTNEEGLHYDQILFIKSEDDKAYFIARSLNKFDVLMWERGQENFDVVKSIVPEISTDFMRVYLREIFTLPNNKIFLSIGVDKLNENEKRTNFSYYFSIDQNQLSISTSIENPEYKNELISVFPNPTNGLFSIEYSDEKCGEISIYNPFGERIKAYSLNNSSRELDLSDQPRGIYFIQLKTCGGEIKKTRVIIL